MRRGLSGKLIAVAALAVACAVLVYAWIDGGREPMRTIEVPVAVPELPR